jgi:general secretion pathway protein D
MIKPILFSALLLPSLAMAKAPSNKCKTLKGCTHVASKILNQKYFYSGELKGNVVLGKGLKLDRDNAEELFTEFLNLHGYTRVAVGENTYKIVSARDIRYTPTKLIRYSASEPEKIPALSDYYMVSFKLKHPENARSVARSFRPFMSRYGRIIEVKSTGGLIIQDTGKNLRRLASLIEEVDHPITDEMREEREKYAKRKHEIELHKAKNCVYEGGRKHRELNRK